MARIKSSDFVDVSGFLRVQEKRLLSDAALDRALDASSPAEALRMLSQNSDYDFSSLRAPAEYENVLKEELRRVYGMAFHLAKDNRQVVDVPAAKYDYHNAKAALKATYYRQRTENPYYRVTDLEPEALAALAADPSAKTEVPGHLADAVKKAREAFEASKNPQSIDISLDKAMFARMLDLCGEMENPFVTGYVEMAADFYNLKTLLRVKAMRKGTAFLADSLVRGGKTPVSFFMEHYGKTPSAMVPVFYYKYFGDVMRAGIDSYEKTGNLSALERLLDNLLIRHVKQAKYLSYGPEILFAYLVSKENEIRQIRILVTCKQNRLGAEALRERLRDNYA